CCSSYHDYFYLHSFPTRRSSDLDSVPDFCDYVFVGPFQNPKDWCLVELENGQWVTEYYDKQGEVCPGWLALAGVYSLSDCSLLRDRKSTRLNSSHVKSSYAVFLL